MSDAETLTSSMEKSMKKLFAAIFALVFLQTHAQAQFIPMPIVIPGEILDICGDYTADGSATVPAQNDDDDEARAAGYAAARAAADANLNAYIALLSMVHGPPAFIGESELAHPMPYGAFHYNSFTQKYTFRARVRVKRFVCWHAP